MGKELTLRGNYDLAAPSQMAQMAKLLQAHITKNHLSTNIQGKEYSHVEGWQFAGGLLGYVARIIKTENLSSGTEKKWFSTAEIIRVKDERLMGNGSSLCSNLETKKRGSDEYVILSMSQTRAIGKAYRNLIGWVMKMAGYESSPAEEMLKVDQTPVQTTPQTPQNYGNSAVKQGVSHKSSINRPFTPKTSPQGNLDPYLVKLKDKLFKLGAKDEKMALRILFQKTGLIWKTFANHGPVNVKEAYTKLLNSK